MEVNILEAIEQADMVLVGLGEEFNGKKWLKLVEGFHEQEAQLEKNVPWMLPVYRDGRLGEIQQQIQQVLEKLADLLKDKNYFVLNTATNKVISRIPWKHGFVVSPCGSYTHKQCETGCSEVLEELDEVAIDRLYDILSDNGNSVIDEQIEEVLGICPQCGSRMVLNNFYYEKYNEAGYLEKWGLYTKWLQGTLNRRLLILELGAEFDCPSVMRWPFEKIAFYNQKATIVRVNERLFQLTEELKEKGMSIPQNAIEWLQML